ncbi:hypothetical protein EIK77_002968 [Talaromyces pinophilus]|uniref:Uncharacterized protein n=1 Tax=Talaromyces pinophilus TaxID=128442 RepID=A0A6V8GYF4_TALPI|nr:hypothetical protein EIK77_002968 [Talaromyces pinophilus]PCG92936.1 Hypothetical protein PENO1_086160 [Penicillium occitanis (nom. inval.)]PCH02231.1 hypothetical protein PENOC_044400 [Penicillium occitanis (nom. inval.)]GAM34092.1 hypothetical protein TCE0_015f01451 [Talaromyces pinophilus]
MDEHDKEPGASPLMLRSGSPSPSISPTPAISSCPSPDRSFSTFSTVSSVSNFSATSATSNGDNRSSVLSAGSKRRGYVRPQGVEFAESAKNRESVMCLGSIAHLQYYFARTGLLDGKGAQMARPKNKNHVNGTKEVPKFLLTQDPQFTAEMVDSPVDDIAPDQVDFDVEYDDGELMLPPTVSTYSVKTHHIPPPPKLKVLRKDLVEALDKASLAVKKSESDSTESSPRSSSNSLSPQSDAQGSASPSSSPKPSGWHEIQGMHILDLVTLAIRSARVYYINHERPERLASIKTERKFREELLAVTDVLKAWASRNFAGGLRNTERAAILSWMAGVLIVLDEERRLEEAENKERASWNWATGDWTGREREREEAFLQTLMNGIGPALPQWTSPENAVLPTPLLSRLRDGRDLIRMHNQAVRKSRRLFGEIKTPHEDIAKPYRRAENLRYWRKAAELRWEIKFDLDVMGVVYGSSDEAWKQFDAALLEWCRGVREEMLDDWRNPRKGSVASLHELPTIFDTEALTAEAA